jgi:hypothetical protein
MSKLTHNRKILNSQTAVLAEPSDHNSCRSGQNSYNFFLYKTQPHCVGLVRKVDLLSKSLGLKQLYWLNQVTLMLAVLTRIFRIFSLQNPHTFSKKQIFPSNFAFFDQL